MILRPHNKTVRSRNQASVSTQLRMTHVDKCVFPFIIICQLRRPNEFKCSQVCYFVHYVEIHQVRRLVFDNYQWCPVSLSDISSWPGLSIETFTQCCSIRCEQIAYDPYGVSYKATIQYNQPYLARRMR